MLVLGINRVSAGNGGKYFACVNNSSGTIFIRGIREACKENETRIEWYSASGVDDMLAAMSSRIEVMEAELETMKQADNEFRAQIGGTDVSVRALEASIEDVHIVLGEWANLSEPMPQPAWYGQVDSMLDWYVSLPEPLPEPAWYNQVNEMLEWWAAIPIPIP